MVPKHVISMGLIIEVHCTKIALSLSLSLPLGSMHQNRQNPLSLGYPGAKFLSLPYTSSLPLPTFRSSPCRCTVVVHPCTELVRPHNFQSFLAQICYVRLRIYHTVFIPIHTSRVFLSRGHFKLFANTANGNS